jgi:hypothetical protein
MTDGEFAKGDRVSWQSHGGTPVHKPGALTKLDR